MTKIKLNTALRDAGGKEIGKDVECLIVKESGQFVLNENNEPIVAIKSFPDLKKTVKDIICESLLYESPQKPLSGAEKNKRYKLWFLVNSSKDQVELSAEQIVTIKDCIGDIQPILIVGQCESLLEGK